MTTKTYDLSFVDPHRRDEVKRRIQVLERFLAAPDRAAAEAAAAELGMKAANFYTLAKAWRLNRDPAALRGANMGVRGHGLTPQQLKIIIWANEAAKDQIISRAVDYALARGMQKGVAMPTTVSIRKHIKQFRTGQLLDGVAGVDFVVDHCLLDLAVSSSEGCAVKPVMTTVLDVSKARILGAALSLVTPTLSSTARASLQALPFMGATAGARRILLLDRPDTAEWKVFSRILEDGLKLAGELLPSEGFSSDAGVLRKRGNGRTVLSLLGRSVLGIRAQSRTGPLLHTTTPARVKAGAQPYTINQAEELLIERIRASQLIETADALEAFGVEKLDRLRHIANPG